MAPKAMREGSAGKSAGSVHQRQSNKGKYLETAKMQTENLKDEIVSWILEMKQVDPDYARYALGWYAEMLPWLRLNAAVREAMG